MRVLLESLGCRLNRAEIDQLARQLSLRGCQPVHTADLAEICVINTCAVTREAERKSRQLIRRLHRTNPAARLIVTGCYATLSPERIAELPAVSRIVSNSDKAGLAQIVAPEPPADRPPQPLFSGRRTRAFVKIQDGCDSRCSYCVTTIARGPGASRPAREIIDEIQSLCLGGCQEAVLTGVHIGSYGRGSGDNPGEMPDLQGLILTILAETPLPRLRLSSIEPWDVSEEFFDLWSDPRLCRQAHLPLQSGSQKILTNMGRRITPAAYKRLATHALTTIPDLALTTDVIVGFPGETAEDFQESLDFVEQLDFARLHVFAFSPRPSTAAASLPDRTDPLLLRQHSAIMRNLGQLKRVSFAERFVGRVMPVLWEHPTPAGDERQRWRGLTDNYLAVCSHSDKSVHNTITPTLLTGVQADGTMQGKIAD